MVYDKLLRVIHYYYYRENDDDDVFFLRNVNIIHGTHTVHIYNRQIDMDLIC